MMEGRVMSVVIAPRTDKITSPASERKDKDNAEIEDESLRRQTI